MSDENAASAPLWNSGELFRALIDTAVDGIIVIDTEGTIQLCSKSSEKMFGFSAGEMIGRNVSMLMPEPYRAGHDGYLAHYHRTGEKKIIGIGREVVGQRKDGSLFPMYLSVGQGEAEGKTFFVGIIRDLRDIKSERASRDDASRLLGLVVESSNDAIVSTTLKGVIASWNASAQRIFGYTEREAMGRHISIIFPPDLPDEETEMVVRLQQGEKIQNFETRRRRKDGQERLVSISVALVRDKEGMPIGISRTARDITERTAAELKALRLQEELAHVGRLTAMGQMSAAFAHELNQPLTAVTNYVKAAQRMLAAENLPPDQLARIRDAMEKAAGQTLRAGTIIRSLRDFVEKRESEKQREDLNQVVREALNLTFVGSLHSDIRVESSLDDAIPPVVMDRVQIQQVLVNLIRNSMEAMARMPQRRLSITTSYIAPDMAEILVRDTGPGLAPEVKERLFQPFVTTKESGMGIGLRICQSMIEAHNGTIRALDEERQGTTFEIHLPLTPATGDV
jgi:two-component system, LuxR family, sensor kinase FixL